MSAELLDLVPQEQRAAAEAYLKTREAYPPKWVQGMLLFGALISVLLCSWGSSFLFGWRLPAWLVALVFTALGWWMSRKNQGRADFAYVFCAQLGLMFAIIGRVELVDWLSAWVYHQRSGELLVVCAVAAVSYPIFKAKIDRLFFCTWALCMAADYADYWVGGFWWRPLFGRVFPLVLFGVAWWIFARRRVSLRPLAYACLIACAYGVTALTLQVGINIVHVLAAGMAAWGVSRLNLPFKTRALLCGGIVVLACWLNILSFMGLFACALGYYWRERLVEWLGLALFACGLIGMYYNMHATLLQKSAWLMLSGACLLAAYAWVRGKYAR